MWEMEERRQAIRDIMDVDLCGFFPPSNDDFILLSFITLVISLLLFQKIPRLRFDFQANSLHFHLDTPPLFSTNPILLLSGLFDFLNFLLHNTSQTLSLLISRPQHQNSISLLRHRKC